MEEQWSVRCVNQLALVDAYYDGRLRIRASTVHPPVAPFFANAESGGDSCKARKKRKRQQEQLADLIARGKFVPLDDHVVTQLQRASSKAKQWAFEGSSAVCSAEEALVVPSSTSDVPVDDFTNDSDDLLFIKRYDQVCVMPRHSRFIKGDVRDVVRPRVLGSFELITMDPPWENKSVDRKRCYTTFQHKELLKLPMPELASTQDAGCVLGIWVTNRPLYTTFILDELLPYWGFDYQDTWYWLKVCATGALVSPLTSPHRLPVEKLIVATRTPSPEARVRLQARLGRTPRVVVSVPLRHSWKPPPESFFGHMSGRKLELFARELRPHWVSIGNEPLKFQELRHFNAMPESNRLQGPRNQGDLVLS